MQLTESTLALLQRRTHRITFTVPACVFEQLISRSNAQGRSISNLCAFLVEQSLQTQASGQPLLNRSPHQVTVLR